MMSVVAPQHPRAAEVATIAKVARVPRLTERLKELFGDPPPLFELLIGHRLGFASARQLAAWDGWGLPIAFHV
jgi:hypothetical protein